MSQQSVRIEFSVIIRAEGNSWSGFEHSQDCEVTDIFSVSAETSSQTRGAGHGSKGGKGKDLGFNRTQSSYLNNTIITDYYQY